jgi:hypothetical protein
MSIRWFGIVIHRFIEWFDKVIHRFREVIHRIDLTDIF